MRVPARSFAALAAALFATIAAAQPYGLLEDSPGYWQPLGEFDVSGGDERTGHYLAFSHYGYNAMPDSFSSISVMQVYNEEQLKTGHGSYWQVWSFYTAKCKEGKIRLTQRTYYNKPRFAGSTADQLWEEKYVPENGNLLDDQYYEVPKPGTLLEAVMKAACSEPVGANL